MKKILIISPIPTHPEIQGNRKSTLSYSEMLAKNGYEIKFLWITNITTEKEEREQTQFYWGKKLIQFNKGIFDRIYEAIHRRTYFKFKKNFPLDVYYPFLFNKFLKKLQKKEKFDTVIVNYVYLSKSFKKFKNVNKILFTHDSFTEYNKKTGSKWFSITANDEAKALNRADIILSVQEEESTYFKTLTLKPVIACFTYFPQFKTIFLNNKILLFIAGSNAHNINGINKFVLEFFPKIREIIPDIQLIIGGNICDSVKDFEKFDGIKLYGNVNNLFDFYSLGDVVINPVFNGSGLKIKSFEALAYGKVLVSHSHNTIGIYNKVNSPILEFLNPEDCAFQIERIFNKENEIMRLKEESINYMNNFNIHVLHQFIKAIENKFTQSN